MSFGMYSGDRANVRIAFKDELVGVFIDRFGRDITIRPAKKKGWSETTIEVSLSNQFFGWIFALGTDVKIISPESIVERYKDELDAVRDMY